VSCERAAEQTVVVRESGFASGSLRVGPLPVWLSGERSATRELAKCGSHAVVVVGVSGERERFLCRLASRIVLLAKEEELRAPELRLSAIRHGRLCSGGGQRGVEQ
jgi:hypothetical protein